MPYGAYRSQPGWRPSVQHRPWLDDNARTSAIISACLAAGITAVATLAVIVLAAPVLLCPLLLLAVIGVGARAYAKGWRPRQRML